MKLLPRKIFACFFFAFTFPLLAQVDSAVAIEDDIIDNLIGESTEESENSELINVIEDLTNNPIDLNSATIDELQIIPYLDFRTAMNIIKYRDKTGRFFSKHELFSVEGLSSETVENILPMVYVQNDIISQNKFHDKNLRSYFNSGSGLKIRSRTSKELQPQDGFSDGTFAGSQIKEYNRLLWKYSDDFQAGITFEKDAGEKPFNEFTSAHLSIKNFLIFDQIILGDFNFQFGQGLAVWSPYGFSKGHDAIFPAKKEGSKFIPYTSTDENNFFRGLAFTSSWNSFNLSCYLSRNYFDASIDSVSGGIISVPLDGYHRTVNELVKRKTAYETSFGIKLGFNYSKNINAGFLVYHSSFNKSFQSYSTNEKSGSSFNYYSFYYDLYFPNINIFGESVYNGKSIASINSFQYSNGTNFGFLVSIRSYPGNYINLHGLGFGEHSKDINNELGIYTGIKWKTAAGIFNFYFDQFKFPLSSYQNPLPSDGNELSASLTSKPLTSFETKLLFKIQNKETGMDLNNCLLVAGRTRQNYRLEISKKLNDKTNLKGRFDFNNFNIKGIGIEKGFLFFQEIKFQPLRSAGFLGRIVFFKTDSFNSAVYEYESGFAGVLSNLALFGEGLRWYLILKYKLLPQVELSIKYAETYKPKETSLGSGYNMINGNLDNALYMQLDAVL